MPLYNQGPPIYDVTGGEGGWGAKWGVGLGRVPDTRSGNWPSRTTRTRVIGPSTQVNTQHI